MFDPAFIPVWLAAITAFGLLLNFITGILTWVGQQRIKKNQAEDREVLIDVKKQSDGMKTELVEAIKGRASAEGEKLGRMQAQLEIAGTQPKDVNVINTEPITIVDTNKES